MFLTLIIATILTWGLAQILIKRGLRYLTPWQSYALDTAIALPLWIPYSLMTGINLSSLTPLDFIFITVLGINIGLYYFVMEKGPLSIVGPLASASPIFTVILSNIFLGEKLTYAVLAGIIITILGTTFLSVPKKFSFHNNYWIFLALLTAVGYGVEGTYSKHLIDRAGNGTFLLLIGLGQAISVIFWPLIFKQKKIIPRIPFKLLIPTLLGVILWNSGTISYALSMELGLSSLVTPLSNLYLMVLVLGSALFLKEKISRIQWFAIIMILAGIILIQIPQKTDNSQQSTNNSQQITINNATFKNSNQQILNNNHQPSTTNYQLNNREKAKVAYVFDGDTIELSDKRRIRYIGINTPELNSKLKIKPDCFATQAAEINKQLVLNQEIEIDKDQSEKDVYGRYLRYVWVDDVFINDFLVRQGFAETETIAPNNKYAVDLKEAEKEAKKDKRGLWGKCLNQSTDNI